MPNDNGNSVLTELDNLDSDLDLLDTALGGLEDTIVAVLRDPEEDTEALDAELDRTDSFLFIVVNNRRRKVMALHDKVQALRARVEL